MQPQGDSIWGNINLCIEIALNIYYLCGEKGEGIVIPKEQAEKDFSPETVAAGKESDGYLYYPKGEAMEMFRQEMLQKRLVMIKKDGTCGHRTDGGSQKRRAGGSFSTFSGYRAAGGQGRK